MNQGGRNALNPTEESNRVVGEGTVYLNPVNMHIVRTFIGLSVAIFIIGIVLFMISNTGKGWVIPLIFSVPALYCLWAVYDREYQRRPDRIGITDDGIMLHYSKKSTIAVPWNMLKKVYVPNTKGEKYDRQSGMLVIKGERKLIPVTWGIAQMIMSECESRGISV